MDEDVNLIYDFDSDASRYKVVMGGAHLIGLFQCDLCVFPTLYYRLSQVPQKRLIWCREP